LSCASSRVELKFESEVERRREKPKVDLLHLTRLPMRVSGQQRRVLEDYRKPQQLFCANFRYFSSLSTLSSVNQNLQPMTPVADSITAARVIPGYYEVDGGLWKCRR